MNQRVQIKQSVLPKCNVRTGFLLQNKVQNAYFFDPDRTRSMSKEMPESHPLTL